MYRWGFKESDRAGGGHQFFSENHFQFFFGFDFYHYHYASEIPFSLQKGLIWFCIHL